MNPLSTESLRRVEKAIGNNFRSIAEYRKIFSLKQVEPYKEMCQLNVSSQNQILGVTSPNQKESCLIRLDLVGFVHSTSSKIKGCMLISCITCGTVCPYVLLRREKLS